MKDYTNFTIEDFAQDDAFIKWVRSGSFDQKLNEFWEQYIFNNPQQKNDILEAKTLILAFLAEQQFVPDDFQQRRSLNKVLEIIHEEAAATKKQNSNFRWKVAAAIGFVLLLSGISVVKFQSELTEYPTHISKSYASEFQNADKEIRSVVLSDGTRVQLQPNSKLYYNEQFSDSLREVYLEGEAFFEVVKNAQKPFLVHTSAVTTRVLGTSFTVRSFRGEDEIKVIVKSGRVSVFKDKRAANRPSEGVVLTPNLQATYSKAEEKISKSLVSEPILVQPDELNKLQFVDTPIEEVFVMMEKAYGVDILFDEQVMKNCSLNASFEDEPLDEKLDLICNAIHATYEILDSQIIIHSKGCYN